MLLKADKVITYWRPICDCECNSTLLDAQEDSSDVLECTLSDIEVSGIPICSECGEEMTMDNEVCYNGEE